MPSPETAQTAPTPPASADYQEPRRSQEEEFGRKLEALLEISNTVGSKMVLSDILSQIVLLTARILDTPDCSIYLLDANRENLVLRASVGLRPDVVGVASVPVGTGLPGLAVQTNEMITVADAAQDPRFRPIPGADEEQYRAYICAPLRMQEDVVGVMTARRFDLHEFAPEERTLFQTICKQVSIVVEKSKMYFAKIEADRLAAISISLSEIAHYIKNLLQGMKGGMYFVDLGLKRGQLDVARKGWEVLQRGNKKIASLVENMLTYSRETQLNFQRHNINSVIYDILHQIDDSAVERGVALVPETYRELPAIEIDYDRIHDALLNLMSNAIDAIPPGKDGGLVIVRSRLSDDGRFIEIAVEDNGAGMSPEVQSKIFNLFFSTKGEKGSGIGLSVTRKIIEQHGGRIRIQSVEGKGTTFTVRLPVERTSA